jgi:hypothetical protein
MRSTINYVPVSDIAPGQLFLAPCTGKPRLFVSASAPTGPAAFETARSLVILGPAPSDLYCPAIVSADSYAIAAGVPIDDAIFSTDPLKLEDVGDPLLGDLIISGEHSYLVVAGYGKDLRLRLLLRLRDGAILPRSALPNPWVMARHWVIVRTGAPSTSKSLFQRDADTLTC